MGAQEGLPATSREATEEGGEEDHVFEGEEDVVEEFLQSVQDLEQGRHGNQEGIDEIYRIIDKTKEEISEVIRGVDVTPRMIGV